MNRNSLNYTQTVVMLRIAVVAIVVLVVRCAPVENPPYRLGNFFDKDGPLANDILYPTENDNIREKRYTSDRPESAWKDGVIPYVFISTFPHNEMTAILAAMREIERDVKINGKNCLTFRERQGNEKYLEIHRNPKGKGCNSAVGYPSTSNGFGKDKITTNLEEGWCAGTKKVVMHELVHAIGFYHEHERPDRDDYIIADSTKWNKGDWTGNDICTAYDYISVVHYNGFKAKDPKITQVGSDYNPGLSPLDVRKIQMKYGCIPRKCDVTTPKPSGPTPPTGTGIGKICKFGQFGGHTRGTEFSDESFYNENGKKITGFSITSGAWIDSFLLHYGGKPSAKRGGKGPVVSTFTFASDEYIFRVDVRASDRVVDQLILYTNKKSYGVYGWRGSNTISRVVGRKLAYVSGRSSHFLNSLTFYWEC